MCLVIVTIRSLVWTVFTLLAATAIFAAVTTPQWLIGPPFRLGLKSTRKVNLTSDSLIQDLIRDDVYQPSLGIYNRCTRIEGVSTNHCASFAHRIHSENWEDYFPTAWQASLVFFSIGLILLVVTLLLSIIGWCKRTIRRKSLFNIAGSIQAFSVLLFVLGLILYPAGWSSARVRKMCGEQSDAFLLGDCNFGWAFYVGVGATLLTCVAAVLSTHAEASTSTDKIEDMILEGKQLICLP